MSAEQANLRANFPQLISQLRDAAGNLPDVHIGVTSTDLGTGAFQITYCEEVGGDAGALVTGNCTNPTGGAPYIIDVEPTSCEITKEVNNNCSAHTCSQANCGFLVPSHVLPLTTPDAITTGLKSLFQPKAAFRVKPQLRAPLYRWMLEFGRRCTRRQMLATGKVLKEILDASMTEYEALFRSTEIDCEWRDEGMLFVFRGNQAMEEFSHTDAMLTDEYGLTARHIPGDELQQFDSDGHEIGRDDECGGGAGPSEQAKGETERDEQEDVARCVVDGRQLGRRGGDEPIEAAGLESGAGLAERRQGGGQRGEHHEAPGHQHGEGDPPP